MGFKPGEKVRVKRAQELKAEFHNFTQGPYGATIVVPGGMNFVSGMEPYGGKIMTISSKTKVGYYLDGVPEGYCFTDAMLDRVGA